MTDHAQPTDTDTDAGSTVVKSLVLLFRIAQVALILGAATFVLGSLSMPAITAVFVWVFAFVLLAFAGVVQAVIMGVRKRWGGSSE